MILANMIKIKILNKGPKRPIFEIFDLFFKIVPTKIEQSGFLTGDN